MKAAAVIQARMNSERLPGKVLMDLCGRPLLWHIIERLRRCKKLDAIIVATSKDKSDDEIVDFCKRNKAEFYRGSLNNVLERFIDVIDKYSLEYVVRVTGDTPFPSPEYMDEGITAIKKFKADLLICENPGYLFGGQGAYSSNAIRKVYRHSSHPLDLEHVGALYFAQNLNSFKVVKIIIPHELIVKNCRLTIDTMEDYRFISKIYEALYKDSEPIDLFALKEWLKSNKSPVRANLKIKMNPDNDEISEVRVKNLHKANIAGTYKIDLTKERSNERARVFQA